MQSNWSTWDCSWRSVVASGCLSSQRKGLMEAFVLALGGGLVGLAGDRLDAQGLQVGDQTAKSATARGVQGAPVVGQEPLRDAVSGDALVDHRDRCLSGLAERDVGGDREPGVIVDELEDHALATARQNVLGGVELPAGVRSWVDEPAPGRPRLLLRFQAGDARSAEDPGQCCHRRHRRHAQSEHLVVDADRAVVKARGLQRGADPECLLLDLLGDPVRGRPWPA